MKLFRFLRAIFVLFFTPLATLLTSIATIFCTVVLRRPAASVQGLAALWARSICVVSGVTVQVEGTETLQTGHPYIFAANHQSQFDIFAIQGFLGIDFRWLAKKELFRVPIWGAAMRRAGYIPIDRSHGRQAIKSLEKAAKKIAKGTSVIIFPEGTRSKDGKLQKFKSGAMLLAIKSGVPLVPVAISGTYDVLPKGHLLVRSGQVRIKVGQPIDTTKYRSKNKNELALLLQEAVADLFKAQTLT